MALTLTSSSFKDGDKLPNSAVFNGFGHSGENRSPDLSWTGVPAGTKSFAVTCYDPDAPTTVGFWHWTLFDIPASMTSLPAGAGTPGAQPAGSTQGYTDFGCPGYGGAAPPPGKAHRYQFALYALDVEKIGLDGSATAAMLKFSMNGHVLDSATLTATYGG